MCALRRGDVVLCPTESVWGLSCDPGNPAALRRLLDLKRRPPRKGMILVAADRRQLRRWVAPVRPEQGEQLEASWPGPNTWIMRARPAVPGLLTGGRGSVAVRVSAHAPVRDLCESFGGALVSTSANLTGTPPARSTPLRARRRFAGYRLAVWPGELGGQARPSRITDLATGRVLRA